MTNTIIWNSLNFPEWEQLFKEISNTNLLQSYDYARAVCPLSRQTARWGLIMLGGRRAGLVQILEAKALGGALHAVICDRGPLWFDGFGSEADFEAFSALFNREFPRRIGRRRRFIPEIELSDNVLDILKNNGFRPLGGAPYQTVWLDLDQDEETLRIGLKKNWRGALKKAEKSGLQLQWDDQSQSLPWLLKNYEIDKRARNFKGPDVRMLKMFGDVFAPSKSVLIGTAMLDSHKIAAILILCHGQSATYQIGWTSPGDGRKSAAHHLLLWEALGILRKKGITSFDLGGINDGGAAGVQKFKSGMGGRIATLPGIFG